MKVTMSVHTLASHPQNYKTLGRLKPRRILGNATLAFAVAGLVLAWNPASLAQVQAQSEPVLEEIIVTAQKREQSLQDTPISVSALTGDELELRSALDISDVADAIPNVQIQFNGGFGPSRDATISIRGIGGGTLFAYQDARVGLYVDGVYLGRLQGGVLSLVDLERVEVLRGPQGTLFGKNTIGGAINLISRRPDTEDFSGYATLEGGDFGLINTKLSLNVPISDELALSVAAVTRDRDPYIISQIDGQGFQDDNTRSARAALTWNPASDWTVDLSADYTRQRNQSTGAIHSFQGFHDPTAGPGDAFLDFFYRAHEARFGVPRDNFVTSDTRINFADYESFDDLDIWGTALDIVWDLGQFDLTSITAYRDLEQLNLGDNDGTPFIITQTQNSLDQNQFSQELRLGGDLKDGRINFTAGLYYFKEESNWTIDSEGGGPTNSSLFLTLEDVPGPLVAPPGAPTFLCPPGPLTPPGFPCFGGAGNPANLAFHPSNFFLPFVSLYDNETTQYAAFIHANFALTDRINLTAGVRFSNEKKEHNQKIIAKPNLAGGNREQVARREIATFANDALLPFDVMDFRDNTVDNDWSGLSPTVSLDYRFNDDVMGYVRYSRGFKSGLFNGFVEGTCACNTALLSEPPVDEEEADSYEIGIKSQWFADRLRINAAIFTTTYDNFQGISFEPQPTNPAFAAWRNQSDSEIDGFELEFAAQLTANFLIEGGLGLLDSETAGINPFFVVPPGAKRPNIPEENYNLSADYTIPFSLGSFRLRADWNYQGEKFAEISNNPLGVTDSYSLLNARVTYAHRSDAWEIAAWVKNLTDESYAEGVFLVAPFLSRWIVPGPPRQYGLSATVRF
jgi:iron complex outermembrane receptor protein